MSQPRILCVVAAALSLSACGALPANKSKVRTVQQVLDNMNLWNGSVLRVRGYMASCGRHDCAIAQTKEDHERFWQIANDPKSKAELPDFLSIGYDPAFDRKAGKLAGRYVIVTGKISTKCRTFSGKHRCLDRAGDILPIDIEAAHA